MYKRKWLLNIQIYIPIYVCLSFSPFSSLSNSRTIMFGYCNHFQMCTCTCSNRLFQSYINCLLDWNYSHIVSFTCTEIWFASIQWLNWWICGLPKKKVVERENTKKINSKNMFPFELAKQKTHNDYSTSRVCSWIPYLSF